ncbi:YheC/YheD family protein [Paenibacillus crassostreae]|uniref:ATP-grasp domain-containing protein n=1 Tax=Paenibacillus crassostreae TaxID=1763538 RepID=A0A167CJA8_9BACL|nr:YheC/YheD family protein [Paenibacillus crassostreae]AOZ91815.1 hypothetical protein LPB68_05985 [Paenibacillus crassostreae]OAB73262.1 hypothetical protein PNBC_14305 [Paenibacillus crassostreae]
MKYTSASIKSKWVKTNWILKHPDLRKHVPQTLLFNKKNLISMFASYSTVYFKPTGGSGGFNVIRMKRIKKGYQIQVNTVKSTYESIDRLYDKLCRYASNKSYLLQKGIKLASTNSKPFDIRVMVQKTNKGAWISSSIFTKIGKKEKVATNYNQGGKIGYFYETMSGAGYHKDEIQRMETKLKKMGVTVGNHFDRQIKGFRELGLDVALDPKGESWILEVNTRPQFYPLKMMKDKKAYQQIISYAKQYGRYK